MDKITFILNTTAANFSGWLEKHTRLISHDISKQIHTETGYVTLQSAHRQGSWENPTSITMDGIYHDSAGVGSPSREVICFDFSRLAADRVEVTGSCEPPALRFFAIDLLGEIAKRWPEATTPVGNFYIEHSEELGIKAEAIANLNPWEKIEDHLWDRVALQMWWEGYTAREIGDKVSIYHRTVTNRLGILRRQYGEEIVPTAKTRRKHLINKNS